MAFKPAARTVVPRKVVCHAQRQESVKQIGSALAATALAAALSLSAVDAAKADVAGLTPCSESKPYAKRQKNEVKALQKRMKQVRLLAHQSTAQHCIKRSAPDGNLLSLKISSQLKICESHPSAGLRCTGNQLKAASSTCSTRRTARQPSLCRRPSIAQRSALQHTPSRACSVAQTGCPTLSLTQAWPSATDTLGRHW